MMSGTIFCVCSTLAISVPPIVFKAMSKRTQEDAGEERVTAKSKPMTNLVSRCRVRDPTVLASTASENPGNTKSESQEVPLSSLNVQQTGTARPVMLASSSKYSEWNFDDKWFTQGWKSGEMLGASTGRPADDKFVIDDDMDSDTVTESDLSLKSRSFLNKVNDRLRKMLNRSPKDLMQDIDKRSMIWKMFMSSTVEASVFMAQTIYIPSKIQEKISIRCSRYLNNSYWNNQMRFSECLKSAGKVLHGNRNLWSMMKKSSVSRMQRFTYSQILCYVLER